AGHAKEAVIVSTFRTTRRAIALAVPLAAIVIALAPATAAAGSALTPVKGATYTGSAHGQPMTVKVSSDGGSVTIGPRAAPSWCHSGSPSQSRRTLRAAISSEGAVKAKLTFYGSSSHAKVATVAIAGNFFNFHRARPAFLGTVTTTFASAANRACNGHG